MLDQTFGRLFLSQGMVFAVKRPLLELNETLSRASATTTP
jgi:hypothetical protein